MAVFLYLNPHIFIKSTDYPQHHWTHLECRAWLIAALTTYLKMSLLEAEEKTKDFKASGPQFYLNTLPVWVEILGESDARFVYGALVDRRSGKLQNSEGSVEVGEVRRVRTLRWRSWHGENLD
jgi:hypothetical protein